MIVRFDKKWFNPLYFILNDLIKDNSIRTILVYGGKSSSKTISISQILAKEAALKKASTIAFRKESTIIKTTLKKSFNLSIESMRLSPAFEKFEWSYRTKQSEIVLKGLDEEEKAKGVESYKYIYLDELNHFSEAEYTQFNLSLRGIEGQKIFASWNPVDEASWVKKNLVDKYEFVDTEYELPCKESFVKKSTCGKVILIKTTYEDNYWITGSPCGTYGYKDDNLMYEYKELKRTNPKSYKINVLGEWGKVDVDGVFAWAFDEEKHISKDLDNPIWKCDPNNYVYLSFDFNRNPITCAVIQYINDIIYVIRQYKLPNSDIYALCDRIKIEYSCFTFIVTGDASGKNGTAMVRDNLNYYKIIKTQLTLNDGQFKIPSVNPGIEENQALVNTILVKKQVQIHPKQAEALIYDLQNVSMNADGTMKKGDRNDTKQQADALDCFRYYLNVFHKQNIKK